MPIISFHNEYLQDNFMYQISKPNLLKSQLVGTVPKGAPPTQPCQGLPQERGSGNGEER